MQCIPIRIGPVIVCMFAAIVLVVSGSGSARGEGVENGDAPNIDPGANRILRAMSEYLKASNEFTFHADVEYDSVLNTGQKLQFGGVSDVTVRRPDRLRAEFRGDERQTGSFLDGSRFTILNREKNLYAQTEVPDNIDDAVDFIFDKLGFSVPIADFVYSDPYEVLTEYVEAGVWVGRHAVDGTPCHHLAFTQESIDWQIWIEDGPRPVPRKIVITYIDEIGSPQYSARLSRWNFQPRVSDAWFVFEPPVGANRIEFLPVGEEAVAEAATEKELE